jgi:Zn-dependent metalloprotease
VCRDLRGSRHPLLCIVPPHLLSHLARLVDIRLRRLAEAALETLVVSERMRGERSAIGAIAPLAATPAGVKRRTIYDAENGASFPGRIVRGEGAPASSDPSVNEAYDGLGATYDLFFHQYQRNSIDGRGMRLDATVHYRSGFNNAFWNGRQMIFGDGDGIIFRRFTRCVEVIGHELTHGVTQYEAGLVYDAQSGALNEHVSDVFGSLVKQYAMKQTARKADWLIGAGLFANAVKGRALRSLKEPGSAYDDPRLGKDPQPGHMRDYVETEDDNGGVHINSGIPNRAFYLVATRFGGHAWRKAGRIWYLALTDLLKERSQFSDAAQATTFLAGKELGTDAANLVRGSWNDVGITVAARPASRREGVRRAHPNRPKRRIRRSAARTRR